MSKMGILIGKIIIIGLFILCGISTLIYSYYMETMIIRIENFTGKSNLIGDIIDEDGNPVEGVEVDINSEKNYSNINGRWTLNNVSEGRVNIIFYKSGYKVITIDWICYPISYIDRDINDLEKTPNHVRNGDKAIILEVEMEYIDYKNSHEKEDFGINNTSVVLNLSGEIGELGFSIEIEDILFNINQSFFFININNSLNLSRIFGLKSGIYNISIFGKDIKDLCIREVVVSKNESVELFINIKKPETIVLRKIDLTMNHIIIAFNLLLSLTLFLGAYICLKNYGWSLILTIAILGFFSRGYFSFGPINMNILIALALLIIIIINRNNCQSKKRIYKQ